MFYEWLYWPLMIIAKTHGFVGGCKMRTLYDFLKALFPPKFFFFFFK